jgi:hypothetical protein
MSVSNLSLSLSLSLSIYIYIYIYIRKGIVDAQEEEVVVDLQEN